MKQKHFLYLLILGFGIMLLNFCANPMMPSGGPKDVAPPEVLVAEPANGSVNFRETKIRLYFNEFVKLNNPNEEVFISPPIKEMPDFKVRGKSVIITFEEPLEDSTTYTIFMGEAIQDITEANPLPFYSYVFSTGSRLDSLSLIGDVYNAFTLKPEPDVLVMLYKDNNDTLPFDSLPHYVKPIYAAKTRGDGTFYLNNLRYGDFKMFALKDADKSMIYEQPNEMIAFLDTLINPYYIIPDKQDSLVLDTMLIISDSIFMDEEDSSYYFQFESDTLIAYGDSIYMDLPYDTWTDVVFNPQDTVTPDTTEYPFYSLALFDEIDSVQRITDAKLYNTQQLRFIFKYPVKDLKIWTLDSTVSDDWYIPVWGKNKDTLDYWITDIISDSMTFVVKEDTSILDTLELPLREVRQKRRRKNQDTTEFVRYFYNARGGKFDYFRNFAITFNYPLINYDFSNVTLISDKDTGLAVVTPLDTGVYRKFRIEGNWKPEKKYSIIMPDSIMTDIRHFSNDSIFIRFEVRPLDVYGLLKLNLIKHDSLNPYILQLLDDKENILREETILKSQLVEYEHLEAGNYFIKVIVDRNRNGRWDTGDYIKNLQPEEVFYFPGQINVRANWEIEEEWDIEL